MILSNEKIEKLIIYKYYNDSNYRSLIEEFCFHKKYFDNSLIYILLTILVNYNRKYKKIPDKELFFYILEKYCKDKQLKNKDEKNNLYNFILLKNLFESCLINDINDENFIKDNILYFIKSKNLYFAVIESLDDIEKKQDISHIIKVYKKIDSINIDQNLGFDYFEQFDKHIQYLLNPQNKIKTGYKQLDFYTNGGFPKDGKCLSVILGQPGLGKSLMLGNLAINFIKQGLNVILISLELHEQYYAQRLSAHISKIDINSLKGNIDILKSRVYDFYNQYKGKVLIKEFPPNSVNSNVIQYFIEKIIQNKFKIDVIIIDYLNLIRPNISGKNLTLYERIGEVAKDLRALSYIYNVPVITASQVNREAYYSSEVGMDNISDSSGIAHTADFIGALWQAEGDREANKLSMTILKNRFGGFENKVIEYYINYNNLLIQDLSEISLVNSKENEEKNILEEL